MSFVDDINHRLDVAKTEIAGVKARIIEHGNTPGTQKDLKRATILLGEVVAILQNIEFIIKSK